MTDVMIDFVWRPALERARRGEPADLARLVCESTPPADVRRDVELILANPVHKRPGHRQRELGDAQVLLAREMFRIWATGRRAPMSEGYAIDHIAMLMGVKRGVMRDAIKGYRTYARK